MKIRTVSKDGIGNKTNVFLVDGETETEISSCVESVNLSINVNDINKAKLSIVLAQMDAFARVEPGQSQLQIAQMLYDFAGKVQSGEIQITMIQNEADLRDVTGLGEQWRSFLSFGHSMYLRWENSNIDSSPRGYSVSDLQPGESEQV